MKKHRLSALCITAILFLLLSSTVFMSDFYSSIPKDTNLSITATGKQSKNSWGQSVRIRNILVDEEPIDFETLLPFCDGFCFENGLLIAHEAPAFLNVTFNNAHRIDVDLISEDGSGFAEIQINDQKKEIDLYHQGGWKPVKWTYVNIDKYAPYQQPLKLSALFYLLYAVVSFLLRIFSQKRSKTLLSGLFLFSGLFLLGYYACHLPSTYLTFSSIFFTALENISVSIPTFILLTISLFLPFSRLVLWALCIFTATEILSLSGTILLFPAHIIFLNILVPIAIEGIVILLIGNPFVSTCFVSALMLFGALANHYTIQFRGAPVSFSDIPAIKTAFSVLDSYTLTFHSSILISILLFILALIIVYPLKNKRIKLPLRCICVLFSVWFMVLLNTTEIQLHTWIAVNMWDINLQCREEGFWLTFFDRLSLSFVSKPDDFSDKTVKKLEENYIGDNIGNNDFQPNIIVVMNESFSNLEIYDEFSSSEPLTPFLYSLKGLPNTHHGLIQVPVLGGGTSTCEFEFLSGMNFLHYPLNSPYNLIGKGISALPKTVKALGYTPIALHPYSSTSWSRSAGLPKVGFERSIFEDTGMQHREVVRGYISDKSFYDEIIMLDQQIQDPLFLFGITMQNHGSYTFTPFEEPIQIVSPAGDYPLATQYINLIRESDRAFENFIDYYEKQEEPTIVLFFGDHLPKIENDLLDSLHASHLPESGRDKLAKYHTPYYIWANFDLDKSQLPAEGSLISLSLLQSVLMKAASLPMTGYQQLLYQLLQQYPVISQHCILDADGNLVETESQDIPILKDYINLQYALLKNKSDLFTFFK